MSDGVMRLEIRSDPAEPYVAAVLVVPGGPDQLLGMLNTVVRRHLPAEYERWLGVMRDTVTGLIATAGGQVTKVERRNGFSMN